MRRFYRCKATLDFGWTRYLSRDATQWIGVEDRNAALVFSTRREALRALADVGGQWAKRGRIVLVTVTPKRKQTNGS
jgi:hypothetical protein